jgi:hypothetical protein
VLSYDAVDTATQIAGRPTVHVRHEASQQAGARDEYYFVKDGQLFNIVITHTGPEDWDLYNAFLASFGFSEQAAEFDYEGWGTYTNEAFGYALRHPAEITVLEAPQGTGIQISGPLVDNERWPVFEVQHFDSDFFHPPADVDLQQWVLDHVPSYDAVDTETQIAGRPTVHLSHEASQQACAFDRYYVVKDGQLFCIVITHTGGQEDWELYDRFLRGLTFLGM